MQTANANRLCSEPLGILFDPCKIVFVHLTLPYILPSTRIVMTNHSIIAKNIKRDYHPAVKPYGV